MGYLVEVLVKYKPGVLNPQGRVIEGAARNLGYKIENLDTGKYFSYVSKMEDENTTKIEALALSNKLLANPVIERFNIVSIKKVK